MGMMFFSFFGDDFTGSTDALETLALAGLRTVLFTRVPTKEQLAQYSYLRAFGVASTTRSMSPDQMEATIRAAFNSLRELGATHVQYKVCSTFDSSPTIGSIGRVIDIGSDVFRARCVPVVVGAPALGRYQVFGNLFARCGTESEPYRLDRHPSMSRHPITPMDEADLCRHLAKQTDKQIKVLDIVEFEKCAKTAFLDLRESGAEVILIDLLHEQQLERLGELLLSASRFVVGSSGATAAICAGMRKFSFIGKPRTFDPIPAGGPIAAVCGSNSPVTKQQIAWAGSNGFDVLQISRDVDAIVKSAIASIDSGRSVAIHSYVESQDIPPIGPTLASILHRILSSTRVRRVLVAGGDTSGEIANALGIESLEMIGELTRGAPLCRATAPNSPAHGIEITFKGGQIGPVSFFGMVERGTAHG
jgi:uncharacterized protein YgbK (DUF1537 family)